MMGRLTTDKKTSEMNMTELALNSCYVKEGEAWYRDYDTNIQAREFVRNLYKHYTGYKMPREDEAFDEFLLDDLMIEPDEPAGLIAIFYRNLWAMAELREKLKKYEDAEEQGLLVRVPIPIGNVYWRVVVSRNRKYIQQSVMSWLNIKNIKRDFGKTVFLTREEAESKLKEWENENFS